MSRRGSTQSQASAMTSSSQFSIPFHLIPERGSSMRDSMVREADESRQEELKSGYEVSGGGRGVYQGFEGVDVGAASAEDKH
ncbi:MAG: hypothetical protein M1823_007961, partial [Watsoniomyces obsoletus]